VHLRGGDCLDANSCAQSPSHLPWEYLAFLTCHACRSPSGTWPSHGSSLSQWLSSGGAYCRVPTPHVRIPREFGLSLLVLGVWLENHFLYLLLLSGVPRPEARGFHAPTVPPPTVLPPPRLSRPMGIRRGHLPGLQNSLKRLYHADPGGARGRSTPEAVDLKETPSLALQYF